MNILKALKDRNINHSVIAEKQTLITWRHKKVKSLIKTSEDYNAFNYFVTVANIDLSKLTDFQLQKSSVKGIWISTKDLELSELDYFNAIKNNYTKVQDTEEGRVYELKDNSFKQYYRSNEDEMFRISNVILNIGILIDLKVKNKIPQKRFKDKLNEAIKNYSGFDELQKEIENYITKHCKTAKQQ